MAIDPPFAELHLHLDGSMRPDTLQELAQTNGVDVPENLKFFPAMGLVAALERFQFTLSLLQRADAVRRVAAEMCEDAESQRVTTLEIRFAPQLHQGASIEAIVDAAIEGIDGRAGLILCGLYGESPDVFDQLLAAAKNRSTVVGIDLAGGPAPNHRWTMQAYRDAFWKARDWGLGRTVHAGEGRPPAEIREAIEQLFAERIGHGTTLLEDPSVVELIIEKEVTIEACVTSNVHTGVITSFEAHPIAEWLERGVRACVCCDNTFLSDTNAQKEHSRVLGIPKMTEMALRRAIEVGHEAAFKKR